jgi:uncharacterized Zn-binding protein involved in type VI secretion
MKVLVLVSALTFCMSGAAFAQSAPAARQGDATSHGGAIVSGSATVRIGGQPAARLGDSTVCPAFSGPVPHVGGPIATGSPSVRINGIPAARVGDIVAETGGPPSVIAPPGAPTVLIGG